MTIVTAIRTPTKGEAAVPSLRVADHTVSSVQVSTRDSLKGGGCSKKASKYPFIFVTARVNFSSCTGGGKTRGCQETRDNSAGSLMEFSEEPHLRPDLSLRLAYEPVRPLVQLTGGRLLYPNVAVLVASHLFADVLVHRMR